MTRRARVLVAYLVAVPIFAVDGVLLAIGRGSLSIWIGALLVLALTLAAACGPPPLDCDDVRAWPGPRVTAATLDVMLRDLPGVCARLRDARAWLRVISDPDLAVPVLPRDLFDRPVTIAAYDPPPHERIAIGPASTGFYLVITVDAAGRAAFDAMPNP